VTLEVAMTSSTHETRAFDRQADVFTKHEELALVGFLAGYSGLTLEAYQLDLRQYVEWCAQRRIPLFGARRADIEKFGRNLEVLGRPRSTIARRLCTVACFYRYAEQEDFIAKSPATHVRRPRLDYESHATGLDRNEVGAILVAAGLGRAHDHALVSLLALNALRVSEATGANIEALGLERGHRTLTILRKGGRTVIVRLLREQLELSTSRSANVAKAHSSWVSTADGSIGTPRPAPSPASLATPVSPRPWDPTRSATRSSPQHSTPAYCYATCKKPPATPTREPPRATTERESRSTVTPPTSSRRSSPAPPADPST
jgi:integrase